MGYYQYFAVSRYDCSAYGSGSFGVDETRCNTITSTSGSKDSVGLANTGYDLFLPLILGLAMVSIGIGLMVKLHMGRKK